MVPQFGIPGGPLAMVSTALLTYPLQVRLARKHGAWDILHDSVMLSAAALIALSVISLFHTELSAAFVR